jgi:tetratricopeptide (TPR) repeat protein
MGSGEQAGTGSDTSQLRPPLRPPGTRPDSDVSSVAVYRWVWIALATVLLLSLAVVFVLPQLVSREATPTLPERPPIPAKVPTPPAVVEAVDSARLRAEQALQEFLQLQAKLALENAEVWGEPAWSQAEVRVASGDRLFGERRFTDAAQAYADALQKLRDLQGKRELLLDAALDLGQRALRNDDAQAALTQFERALAIEPDHQLAINGLRRAQVRAEVLEHMAAGHSAESDGDPDAAQAAYRRATQLDAEYQPAIENLQRVSAQIIDLKFRAAMSEALGALDGSQLKAAAKALSAAAELKPEDSALRDARLRLAAARQQVQLSGLRRRADKAIEKENWQTAAGLYQKALAVDADAAFARTGLRRVKQRLQLHQQFDHYLNDPARLSSSEPLANAEKLLLAAGEAPDGEPRLAEKISLLKRYVGEARLPLPVRLYSDGETEVVIYHVGRLGRFRHHQLELRPGTYTAVGSRAGFRDVRRVFSVSPGKPPPPVDIRCEEPV